jgi:hypothetical protein
VVLGRLARLAHRGWSAIRRNWTEVSVEVLVVDRARRREVEREVRAAVRRLRRLLADPCRGDVAVLVQEVVQTDRQLAGCTRITERADGSRLVLVQLALRVDGRRLGIDEVLSALAEQCVALATETSGRPSVLTPVEGRPLERAGRSEHTELRPDPLVAPANGRVWPPARGAA